MTFEDFKNRLDKSTQEDEVRRIYATYFKIKYNTADRHDLYTPQVLFEFKADKNFQNLKALVIKTSFEYFEKTYKINLIDKNKLTEHYKEAEH